MQGWLELIEQIKIREENNQFSFLLRLVPSMRGKGKKFSENINGKLFSSTLSFIILYTFPLALFFVTPSFLQISFPLPSLKSNKGTNFCFLHSAKTNKLER